MFPFLWKISPALSGDEGPLEETFLGGRGGGAVGGKKVSVTKLRAHFGKIHTGDG